MTTLVNFAPNCGVKFIIVLDDASLPYDRNLQFKALAAQS